MRGVPVEVPSDLTAAEFRRTVELDLERFVEDVEKRNIQGASQPRTPLTVWWAWFAEWRAMTGRDL